MQLTTDLSGLHPETRQQLIKRLAHEDAARYALGAVDQIRLKRYHDAVVKTGAFNEMGPVQMVISQDQYTRAMEKYGPLCFMDPDFVPFLLRKNDDMRVKQAGTRIQSGYTAGMRNAECGMRKGTR